MCNSGGLCCIRGWEDEPGPEDISAIQFTLTSVIVEVLLARTKLVHFDKMLSLETARRYSPLPAAASLWHTSEETVLPIPRTKRRNGAFEEVEILSRMALRAISSS